MRIILLAIFLITLIGTFSVSAQEGANAWTNYVVNVRSGPAITNSVLATLPANTALILEGRNADGSWLLGQAENQRGWVSSLYVRFADGFSVMNLPLSDEVITVITPPAAGEDAVVSIPILDEAPILPVITPHVRAIFAQGQTLGNHPNVVAKVGDCNSVSPAYLTLIQWGNYDLGPYTHLQETIQFFNESLGAGSLSTHIGFTAMALNDPAWANADVCAPGLSPLECEYEHSRPSVALIMLGLQDVHFLSAADYEQGMRQIIEVSLDYGVIPVLTTFPVWSGENDRELYAKRLIFDTLVVNLAREYDVPLINFWRAAQLLPTSGLSGDLIHLSYSGTESQIDFISFRGDEAQYGFTLWDLLALQSLDAIRTQVIQK